MNLRWCWSLPILALAGCGSSDQLFPLRLDNEWSYSVKTGIPEYVEEIKVTKRVPVDGIQGYELQSAMGISRLAWRGETLLATALTGTRFRPALPMLSSADDRATFQWEGTVYSGGRAYKGKATVSQSSEPLTRDGRKTNATKTILVLMLPDREVETVSWYVAGNGLVMQVQRTKKRGRADAEFDFQLDYLGGP